MFFFFPDVAFISCYSDLASRIVFVTSSLRYDETVSSTASCLLKDQVMKVKTKTINDRSPVTWK